MKSGKLKIIISCCLFVFSINSISFADTEKTHEPPQNTLEIKWHPLEIGLNIARNQNKITMIDFSADWCESCKELDLKTYSDKKVINEVNKLIAVKIDATNIDKQMKELFNKYKINGELPGIVFIDKNGKLLSEYSISGFKKPEEFLKILKTINYLDVRMIPDKLE